MKQLQWSMEQPPPPLEQDSGAGGAGRKLAHHGTSTAHHGTSAASTRGRRHMAGGVSTEGQHGQQQLGRRLQQDSAVQDGPLFVDVGANVGWFSINMASAGYRVAAFEGGGRMLRNVGSGGSGLVGLLR